VFTSIFKLLDGVEQIFKRDLALGALFIRYLGHHAREVALLALWVGWLAIRIRLEELVVVAWYVERCELVDWVLDRFEQAVLNLRFFLTFHRIFEERHQVVVVDIICAARVVGRARLFVLAPCLDDVLEQAP